MMIWTNQTSHDKMDSKYSRGGICLSNKTAVFFFGGGGGEMNDDKFLQ